MSDHYPTKFTDANGTEETSIINNGETLRMVLRGITFEDTMFDSFEPVEGTDPALLNQFTLNRNELCECLIEFDIPIPNFFQIFQQADRFVQETYLCEEFERRIPGTGCRG